MERKGEITNFLKLYGQFSQYIDNTYPEMVLDCAQAIACKFECAPTPSGYLIHASHVERNIYLLLCMG